MFKDRQEAGALLAGKLAAYRGKDAVVIGLPRGGVAVAAALAHGLALPLDIVVTRKIGHPLNPEYAIGVVNEKGETILNEAEAATVDSAWLTQETARQKREAKRRIGAYRGAQKPASLSGKSVVVVDDGIATGLTMRLAVRSVKKQRPARLIVAVPVAPRGMEGELRAEGMDEFVTLVPGEEFLGAVGAHYGYFPQTTDAEVVNLLHTL
jgi:predicted phosphoribosyltransferase